MSQHTYSGITQANGDLYIKRDDGVSVIWSDPDFQAWNTAQTTPLALSAVQSAIQQAKQMTFAQFQTWWTGATAAQQQRLIFELLQRALRNEIV